MKKIRSSEITPEAEYFSRRRFLKNSLGLTAASLLAACAPQVTSAITPSPTSANSDITDEFGDPLTDFSSITNFNNFYEFTMDKSGVAKMSQKLITSPWQVQVSGLVLNPKTYDVNDLEKKFGEEERIYRLRCVEGWSMVIPWMGFSLAKLLKEVQPTTDARYVRFESLHDPKQFPGQTDNYFPWPYVEGLRLDEAMHDLTLMVTGVYGKPLPPQNGAPLRLAVPWKYGFKSIKSIVKIELVKSMPSSLWMSAAPQEYGFYANVNPDVAHPRWSQATERRIGTGGGRKPTLKFNGYSQVGQFYKDLDLAVWY